MDFSDPRKIPPIPPLTRWFPPATTSLEEIKLFKKKCSPSEGSDITVVVSSVAANLKIVFSVLFSTRQGVDDIVTETRVRFKNTQSHKICMLLNRS